MDEKEKLKQIFGLLKIFLILNTIAIPFIGVTFLISKGSFMNFINMIIQMYMFTISLIVVFFLIYMINYLISKKSNEIITKEYIRDITDVKYGSSIASLLLDNNTEIAKDYTSTIIDLCRKKYLEMVNINGEYKFYLINNNDSQLGEHEKYVIECIIGEKEFDDKIYKQKLQEDAVKLGYLEKGTVKTMLFKILLQFMKIIIIFSLSILVEIFHEYIVIQKICPIIQIILFISFYIGIIRTIVKGTSLARTKIGKIEAKKWKKFKNYINDYTLIKNKNIEDVVLFEEYLAFAVAVGEANQIEKFIIKDEKYRKLIYKQLNK